MFTNATPEMILEAYAQGIFPMADSADSLYFNFYRPDMRGQLPIEELHISKKLMKAVKNNPYEIKINSDFEGVIAGCAQNGKGRKSTWINKGIRDVFIELHYLGFAHSVECWLEGALVGGLYGLAIGGVFCGESMFSTKDNASKIALVHLCARLSKAGFTILDTQFINDHLKQFGVYEIAQEAYETSIKAAMQKKTDFLLSGITEDQIMRDYFEKRNSWGSC